MTETALRRLLKLAGEQVAMGVYAIRKGNYVELRNDPMTRTQLKRARREYNSQGIKIYANGL